MHDLVHGRGKVARDGHDLKITIRAKRSLFVTVFLAVWLTGWAFGEFTVLSILVFNPGPEAPWLLIWFAGWTVGGGLALLAFLWNVSGKETLRITPQDLTVTRSILAYRRRRVVNLPDVQNFRTAPPVFVSPDDDDNTPGIFRSWSTGALQFDHGEQTVGFGLEIDTSDAERILEIIADHYDYLAGKVPQPIDT